MKRLFLLVSLSACTFLPQVANDKPQLDDSLTQATPEVYYILPEVIVSETREVPKKENKRVNLARPCMGIDTGDLRRDINMKLDCFTEIVRYR